MNRRGGQDAQQSALSYSVPTSLHEYMGRYMDSVPSRAVPTTHSGLSTRLYSPAALSPSFPVRRWFDNEIRGEVDTSPTIHGATTSAGAWRSTSYGYGAEVPSFRSDSAARSHHISYRSRIAQVDPGCDEDEAVSPLEVRTRPEIRRTVRTHLASSSRGRTTVRERGPRDRARRRRRRGSSPSHGSGRVSSDSSEDVDGSLTEARPRTGSAASARRRAGATPSGAYNIESSSMTRRYADERAVDSRSVSRQPHGRDEGLFQTGSRSGGRGGGVPPDGQHERSSPREDGPAETRPPTNRRTLSDFLREIEQMLRVQREESEARGRSSADVTAEAELLADPQGTPAGERNRRPARLSTPSREGEEQDQQHANLSLLSHRRRSPAWPLVAEIAAGSSDSNPREHHTHDGDSSRQIVPRASSAVSSVATASRSAPVSSGDSNVSISEGVQPLPNATPERALVPRGRSRLPDTMYGEEAVSDPAPAGDRDLTSPRDGPRSEGDWSSDRLADRAAHAEFAAAVAAARAIAAGRLAQAENANNTGGTGAGIRLDGSVGAQTPPPSVPRHRVFGALVQLLPSQRSYMEVSPSGSTSASPSGGASGSSPQLASTDGASGGGEASEGPRGDLAARTPATLNQNHTRLHIQGGRPMPQREHLPPPGLRQQPTVFHRCTRVRHYSRANRRRHRVSWRARSPPSHRRSSAWSMAHLTSDDSRAADFVAPPRVPSAYLSLLPNAEPSPERYDTNSPAWLEEWLDLGAPANHGNLLGLGGGESRCPRVGDVWELLELLLVYWAERVCAVAAQGVPKAKQAWKVGDEGSTGRVPGGGGGEAGSEAGTIGQAVEAVQDLRGLRQCLMPLSRVRRFVSEAGGPTPRDAVLLKSVITIHEGVDWATERPLFTHYRDEVIPSALALYTALAQDTIEGVDLEVGYMMPDRILAVSRTERPSWPRWSGVGRALYGDTPWGYYGANIGVGEGGNRPLGINQSTPSPIRESNVQRGVRSTGTVHGDSVFVSSPPSSTAVDPDGAVGEAGRRIAGSHGQPLAFGADQLRRQAAFVPGPWVVFLMRQQEYLDFYRGQASALEQLVGGMTTEDVLR